MSSALHLLHPQSLRSVTDGVTTLRYTVPLTWLEQFSARGGPVTLVYAHGSATTSLSYHGVKKGQVLVDSFGFASPPPLLPAPLPVLPLSG